MGPSFFHDAEGQDDKETDEDEDETALSGNESQDSSRDEQHDNSDNDSVASSVSKFRRYISQNTNFCTEWGPHITHGPISQHNIPIHVKPSTNINKPLKA